jgi:hypothetical protein
MSKAGRARQAKDRSSGEDGYFQFPKLPEKYTENFSWVKLLSRLLVDVWRIEKDARLTE